MARPPRVDVGGLVYHAFNRANAQMRMFDHAGDYHGFERVLAQAVERVRMRVLAYCVMPNHWHMVLWPRADGDLSRFVGWLTLTHTQRWHAFRGSAGRGHLYQGRYKSFVVQSDDHLITVCRYVERNALRAGLVDRAEDWKWSSLWRRTSGSTQSRKLLSEWPVDRPRGWRRYVNEPLTDDELDALRRCIRRGRPYGHEGWLQRMVRRFGLESTLSARGRPTRGRAS